MTTSQLDIFVGERDPQVYLRNHPDVYVLFREEALSRARGGARRIGAKGVVEAIRHKVAGGINNSFVSAMAHRFVGEFPEYSHLFEFR